MVACLYVPEYGFLPGMWQYPLQWSVTAVFVQTIVSSSSWKRAPYLQSALPDVPSVSWTRRKSSRQGHVATQPDEKRDKHLSVFR